MLLLDGARLADRKAAVAGPLAMLRDSLAAELEPALGASPYIPRDKALLSRAGGRCEIDGTALDFDPASPQAHRCPTCGRAHRGELHDRAWITSYQLWLAERALQAALFNLLQPEDRHASFARNILRGCADLYLRYPNVDNVLGPTRLFFSTYLESIWLLQICLAADFLEQSGDRETSAVVLDRIVEPSRGLIASYDEGMSNRQVWNNAALLAAAALMGDEHGFDARLSCASGLTKHLDDALLPDGTWYEGENYHQFALRGLWYCVTLAESRGRCVDANLIERFQRAFAAPYLTALPDFTMPSRKDSQYAVSLRQWRFAEFAELGFARARDPMLAMALQRSYEGGHERRDTGRSRSAADVERNMPSSALTRADLGWRALLHALPELPPLPAGSPRSALLEGQGLAVFRRADDVYVGMDYGQSGGGHGHPDRLNLILSQGRTRWLDDMGTGSYVDPSLHWFRSTLAHNAPIANGRSQQVRGGQLLAHEEREVMGWICAEFSDEGPVSFRRAVVVAPGYLLDELHWVTTEPARIELPWHVEGTSPETRFQPSALDGGTGIEDGYDHVESTMRAEIAPDSVTRLEGRRESRHLRVFLSSPGPAALFSAEAPGQPPASRRRFFVLRADTGSASAAEPRSGLFRAVVAWSDDVQDVTFDASHTTVVLSGGERHVHTGDETRWRVDLYAGSARSSIDLEGGRPRVSPQRATPSRQPTALRRSRSTAWLSELSARQRSKLLAFDLAEPHYRRSESSWSEAGHPHATVAIAADDRHLVILGTIEAGEMRFALPDASNALDNENADTMAAGLQLYARSAHGTGAWMLIPETGSDRVRVREITGWGGLAAPRAHWRPWREGYEVRIELPVPGLATQAEHGVDLDLLINETVSGRRRRRGQLVMSGAAGEFVYLRGDRHDPACLIPLVIVP